MGEGGRERESERGKILLGVVASAKKTNLEKALTSIPQQVRIFPCSSQLPLQKFCASVVSGQKMMQTQYKCVIRFIIPTMIQVRTEKSHLGHKTAL